MKVQEKQKVLVAMSGGADSSLTAALLKSQGFSVMGVYLQLWDTESPLLGRFEGRCCPQRGSTLAQRACKQLDIPYYQVNAQDEFQDKVVDYFVHEFLQNRTPNPCIPCNSQIKFKYLFEKADELGCSRVATGHYAQVIQDETKQIANLHKAVDPQKDQTYFLCGLTQKELRRTLMPLGSLTNVMVSKLAEEFGLSQAEQTDGQEVCFIRSSNYIGFIESRADKINRPFGSVRTQEGDVIGEHQGLHHYRIGQQAGLNLWVKEPEKYYVIGFDPKDHDLIVGFSHQLFQGSLVANQLNWVRPINELRGIRCTAQIRPQAQDAACKVTCFEGSRAHVTFDDQQMAITPGQAIVFYQGDEALGGGFIESVGIKAI